MMTSLEMYVKKQNNNINLNVYIIHPKKLKETIYYPFCWGSRDAIAMLSMIMLFDHLPDIIRYTVILHRQIVYRPDYLHNKRHNSNFTNFP